ncbi:MAG: helix-turn-helix domain-containing protein, partial [Pyramidobacter sp.]|nr:helix-turn-helix domain-containing protein [Pyramidobacter sp.]
LAVSYQEAWKALFLGKKFCTRPGVYEISEYRLEDVITTIDAPVRARYVRAVTGSFRSDPDWNQMRETIRGWCESSFSLIEAAKRLHIHRNTLIYRMDKIARETGLDLHDFRTCLNLYLALVMDQYTGPAVKEQSNAENSEF